MILIQFWLTTLMIIGVTIWFLVEQWRSRPPYLWNWLIDTLSRALFFILLFFIGTWDVYGYYLRFLIPILFLIIVLRSFFQIKHLPWRPSKKDKQAMVSIGINILVSITFGYFIIQALVGFSYSDHPIHLQFPLKNGTYYVGHGGSSTLINYHHRYSPQEYALDILKLNRFGYRANGLYPSALDQYEIYGETIYSPCKGKIVHVHDGLKELQPNQMNNQTKKYRTDHPAGNQVTIQCKDVKVQIAHMIPGSIKVKKGEKVDENRVIGRVGNSGNTSEPHMHIHAERKGKGVPILFHGKFLKRNDLLSPLDTPS